MTPMVSTFSGMSSRGYGMLRGPLRLITLDNSFVSSSQVGDAAPVSMSFTFGIGNQPNRILMVGICVEATSVLADARVSNVRYGGVALTKIGAREQIASSSFRPSNVEQWYLLNPPVGSASLEATFQGAATRVGYSVAATSLYNAAQKAPFNFSSYVETTLSSVTSFSQSVTLPKKNSTVFDTFNHAQSLTTFSTSSFQQQLLYSVNVAGALGGGGGMRLVTSSGAFTTKWNWSQALASGQIAILVSSVVEGVDSSP